LYFTPGEQTSGRNDFLGRRHAGKTLQSFGVNPGGYVGYLDPATGQMDTFTHKADEIAEWRLAVKQQTGLTRRGVRYQEMAQRAAHKTAT
jgi:hypothetical protein